MSPGTLVKFTHWTSYTAPAESLVDEEGRSIWFEVLPGDVGVVIKDERNEIIDQVVVLFSRFNVLLKIHSSMLTTVVD